MKIQKHIVSLLLALCIGSSVGLVACDNNSSISGESSDTSSLLGGSESQVSSDELSSLESTDSQASSDELSSFDSSDSQASSDISSSLDSSAESGPIEEVYPSYTLSDASNPLIEEVYASVDPSAWEEYFIVENGRITGLSEEINTDITTLVVPSTIKGEKVTEFALYGSVKQLPKLERIVFCEGITSIAYWSIAQTVKEIFLPNSLTTIQEQYSIINSRVENIFVRADNPVFKSIDGNVYSKDGKTLVLYACKKTATSFAVPLGVTKIADGVGAEANYLVNVCIPDTVSFMGYIAFNATNVQYTVHEGLRYLGNENNPYLFFDGAESGVSIVNIHEKCKMIGDGALPDSLTSVVIPSGVEFISEHASMTTNTTNLQYNELDGLYYLGNEENPYLYLYKHSGTGEIHIHPDCKFVSMRRFRMFPSITSIRLPDSVTEIPDYAFQNCYQLKTIELGNGVQKIGKGAFHNCFQLQSIRLPASLTEIDVSAFSWQIDALPGQDKEILSKIAKSSLTSIQVDEENPVYSSIDGNLYSKDGKTLLFYAAGKTETFFAIPEGTVKIGAGAFDWRYCLESIKIPVSVTEIGGSLASQTFQEIYYQGSEADWNKITFLGELLSPDGGTVHYNFEAGEA